MHISLLTFFFLISTNTIAHSMGGGAAAPGMDPMTMMGMMGGMGAPGMMGGLPGAKQMGDVKKLIADALSKVPTAAELFEKCKTVNRKLRSHNRDRNLPFIRRLERLIMKLGIIPDFSSIDDIHNPKPRAPLSDTLLMRYERHLRCLATLAAVNDKEHEKEYEVVLQKIIKRYDLLHQLAVLSRQQKIVRDAFAKLCKSDQKKFNDGYSRQRSLLAQQANQLTQELIPLEVALCIDRRSWLETYGNVIKNGLYCIGTISLLRLIWPLLPGWRS